MTLCFSKQLRDRFKVGNETSISFDIKPRSLNGLLLSVYGKDAMFVIQLVNGTINFTVDNGSGPFSTVFKLDGDKSICDGEWHTIQAIKTQYVITLTVDQVQTSPGFGEIKVVLKDTSRPLFLGGHPHLTKARGLIVRKPFNGCIRNVKIKDAVQPISLNMAVGNVRTGVCPLN